MKDLSKILTFTKWFLVVFLAALGWGTFSLATVSADMNGSEYGALAVILFEVAIVFFAVAIVMAIDLVSRATGKSKIYLRGKRLAYVLGGTGFLSTIPLAILFELSDSPVLVIYTLFASTAPVLIYNWIKKDSKPNRKPLID